MLQRSTGRALANLSRGIGMMAALKPIEVVKREQYRIVVQGSLDEKSGKSLRGMQLARLTSESSPVTVLEGELDSYAALLELLIMLHRADILLLAVTRLESCADPTRLVP